jgi:putative nucleotidyltransferase with HDIG domain
MVRDYKDKLVEQKRIIAKQEQVITEHLATIANHANTIRIKDKLYLDADKTLRSLIQLLTKLVELRDPYTQGHSQKVSALAVRIAKHSLVSFPEDKLPILEYGALLHDIGKIVVSDFVLSKPTLLTEAEIVMIRQHTIMGHKLLVPLDFDPMLAEIALYHHENYDGSGYPSGLKSSEIPLAARIVRVADVYDALISNRPYRAGYSKQKAINIMEQEKRHFDPVIFDALLNLVLEKKIGAFKAKAG